MIISSNRSPTLAEFESLVKMTTSRLNDDAAKIAEYYMMRNGQLLEDDVAKMLTISAQGTKFEGTIKKISGQRFPDIVAAKYYGIEVKSSKDDKWTTLGGSVNESTRIEGVERIFVTFGKLTDPIEFKSRPYEDCLSDVVVTHYPRYKIDMKLIAGETIFDKMQTSYDELRTCANPVGKIVDYYKSQLADGESLWWTGKAAHEEQVEAVPMKIRLWRTLSIEEKQAIRCTGIALFPDLLSSSSAKYERFSMWLAATHGIVSTSTRDTFSAGGQGTIITSANRFEKVPRILLNVHENSAAISHQILTVDESVLRDTWRVRKLSDDRIGQWIDTAADMGVLKDHNIRTVLSSIFNRN